MFLFPIGLVDDIMLREVDAVLKQTSILGKIAVKFDNSLQKCKSEGKHWKKNDLSLKDSSKTCLSEKACICLFH